jgi:hypothetical protein
MTTNSVVELDVETVPPEQLMTFLSNALEKMGVSLITTVARVEGGTQQEMLEKYNTIRDTVNGLAESIDMASREIIQPDTMTFGVVLLAYMELTIRTMTAYVEMVEEIGTAEEAETEDELMKGVTEVSSIPELESPLSVPSGMILRKKVTHDH